jgi:hypothetical protein
MDGDGWSASGLGGVTSGERPQNRRIDGSPVFVLDIPSVVKQLPRTNRRKFENAELNLLFMFPAARCGTRIFCITDGYFQVTHSFCHSLVHSFILSI